MQEKTMTNNPLAALLRDVQRFSLIDGPHHPFMGYATSGEYMHVSDVLAALTLPDDDEAEAVIESLRLWNRDDAADLITALLAQRAADAARIREMALDVLAADGQAQEAYEAQLAAEARIAALTAQVEKLRGALEKLHHAVCGETGFAACVRLDSGKAYPWPALDEADAEARAAITEERT